MKKTAFQVWQEKMLTTLMSLELPPVEAELQCVALASAQLVVLAKLTSIDGLEKADESWVEQKRLVTQLQQSLQTAGRDLKRAIKQAK